MVVTDILSLGKNIDCQCSQNAIPSEVKEYFGTIPADDTAPHVISAVNIFRDGMAAHDPNLAVQRLTLGIGKPPLVEQTGRPIQYGHELVLR